MNTRSTPAANNTTSGQFEIRRLSAAEIANPHLVIQQFFTNTQLHDLREALWQWLKLTITGTYTLEAPLERANLIYLYEKLERLVEAVWVMERERL